MRLARESFFDMDYALFKNSSYYCYIPQKRFSQMKGKIMSKVVLAIGSQVKNGMATDLRELHSAECRDLTRLRNDSFVSRGSEFTEYDSIDDCRAEYDIDSEEMGWYFDEDVKVLPCAL